MKRKKMCYPGVGYIGNNKISGLYGVNGGIVDAKGTGIQHLFYNDYKNDLIHTGCTMLQIEDRLYYGNKLERSKSHQVHLTPCVSKTINGHIYYDAFDLKEDGLYREDYVTAYDPNIVTFRTKVNNYGDDVIRMSAYSFINVNPFKGTMSHVLENHSICVVEGVRITIKTDQKDKGIIIKDAPTGFLYRTTQALIYEEAILETCTNNETSTSLLRKKSYVIKPGETVEFNWCLIIEAVKEVSGINQLDVKNSLEIAKDYWDNWFDSTHINRIKESKNNEYVKTNLAAMKSCLLNGFVPADLTGHYYANNMPCYYARDAMMVARSFLMAGCYSEFKEVINYLITRERKNHGEFYQRYNGSGMPDEGANNNVYHQLDSIGFFLYNIRKFFELTGELLIAYVEISHFFELLDAAEMKNNLIGVEGGVNEGVYGGAYITSSNAFICGGLNQFLKFAKEYNDLDRQERCQVLINKIEQGIKATYMKEEQRYAYGYVDYSNTLVKKYDTPLYFGILFGWQDCKLMRYTHRYYLNHATYFGEGIGYSEQEYHHGPWMFNTCAATQYCYIIGDEERYNKMMLWLNEHTNRYGLLPEAIAGEDEQKCYINPLTWACSEYVATAFIGISD